MEVNVEHLKELRQQKALSMRELAEAADVSYHTVYNAEKGKSLQGKSIRKLAAGLGVEVEALTMPNKN